MPDGFRVDLGALIEASGGIVGTLRAASTQQVKDIDCDKSAFGHDHLGGTVSDFCERWQIGVQHLTEDVQEVAVRLVRSATSYLAADTAGQDRLEGILQGAGPDPGAG